MRGRPCDNARLGARARAASGHGTHPGLPLRVQRPPDLLLEQGVGSLQGLVLPGQLAEAQVGLFSGGRLAARRRGTVTPVAASGFRGRPTRASVPTSRCCPRLREAWSPPGGNGTAERGRREQTPALHLVPRAPPRPARPGVCAQDGSPECVKVPTPREQQRAVTVGSAGPVHARHLGGWGGPAAKRATHGHGKQPHVLARGRWGTKAPVTRCW